MTIAGGYFMRIGTFAAISLMLSGCSTLGGPPPIFKATGPYIPEGGNFGLVTRFSESAAESEANPADQVKATAMLDDGFTLVYANCNDFFLSSGRQQSSLIVLRDSVATIGTLAASAIALGNINSTNSKNALAIVTLGTATALAGLDIYTQRFLFGAENVDAVRELTLNALSVHIAGVRQLQPRTYQSAVMHLFDNQAICTPRHIYILAREAIQNGQVTSAVVGQGGVGALSRSVDEKILKELGKTLNPPSSVSADQAGAFYWLLFLDATETERKTTIRGILSGLPDSSNPFDAKGNLKSPVPNQALIEDSLSKLTPATRQSFAEQVAAKRADVAAGGAAAPVPGLFALETQDSFTPSRVSVGIGPQ